MKLEEKKFDVLDAEVEKSIQHLDLDLTEIKRLHQQLHSPTKVRRQSI